jgi:glutamate formiminotransferase/glutamate formiminotransferase/formiminotetrahydrofolate cyclodeaminase
MEQIVQCIPNFSEGRNVQTVNGLIDAVRSVSGVFLLDQTMDTDHNRSVLTLAGPPEACLEAAFRAACVAKDLIDLRHHQGEHPRVGATDVIPFVPLRGATMEICVLLAKQLGQRIGRELEIPVFLYERATTRPDHANLEYIRHGGLVGLAHRMATDPDWQPDFGPPSLHPTAGACIVGARPPLIAFNVNLQTNNLEVAKAIAKKIRSSGGGFKSVKAIGVTLASRGIVQVAMNLTNFQETPLHTVFEAVSQEAEARGVRVLGSEVIGLIPQMALIQAGVRALQFERFIDDHILEVRLAQALGQTEGAASDTFGSTVTPINVAASLTPFLEAVSRRTSTPAGGSAAALVGALAAALGMMGVSDAHLTVIERRLSELRARLHALVQADADAYAKVLDASRLPKSSAEKSAMMAASLLTATEIPLEIGELTCEVGTLLQKLLREAPTPVATDIRVACILAKAAGEAALVTAKANIKRQPNQQLVEPVLPRLSEIERRLEELKGLC